MKKNYKFLIIIILLFIVRVSYSQEFSMIDEIKKQLSKEEQTELTKAQDLIKLGDDLIESGENLMNQSKAFQAVADKATGSEKKKNQKKATTTSSEAYSKYLLGSENYKEANKIVYNLYKKNLKILKAQIPDPNKVSQIEELEDEASNYYVQGTASRKQAERVEENDKKYKLLVDGEQLETDAISIQIQAYSIYYGWFEPDSNEVLETVVDNIVEPKVEIKKDTNLVKTATVEPKIVFRIQIAASTVQLSMSKLRQIYPSSEIIYTDIDKDWYKYMVGNYKTYEDAYAYKTKMGVSGAFIVAYKDNVRVINITEVCSPTVHPAKN